ncbi:MAG TPA: flagellar hook-basal body protein [Bacillota bacterium]
MFRGLYTAATGMNFQLNRQDTIANNLANISTVGYKRDETVASAFRERLVLATDRLETNVIGRISLGVNTADNFIDTSVGSYMPTENPFDLAIHGVGYFAVQTRNGIRLTRSGDFSRDLEGFLVTRDGERVMGTNGPILIDGEDFQVAQDGSIQVNGLTVNRILVVNPVDPNSLVKEGHNRFRVDGELEASMAVVEQGVLEQSNVNSIQEMVKMIEVTRAYESNQKVIAVMDTVMNKVANEIGRA